MTISNSSRGARFSTVHSDQGYDIDEVDAYLARVERALAGSIPSVTAGDLEKHRFAPVAGRAGYDPAEVEVYLQRLAADLHQREAAAGPERSPGRSRAAAADLPERVPSQPLGVRLVAALAILALLALVVAQVL